MTQKPPSTKRPDGTISALASALGVSKRRIGDLLRQGMPDTVEAALAWRSARENDDSTTELRRRRIGLLREQERIAKTKADEADGLLVSRDECRESWRQLGAAVAAVLTRLEKEIPQVCLGLPLSQSLPKTKSAFHDARKLLADAESDFWKSHPLKTTSPP